MKHRMGSSFLLEVKTWAFALLLGLGMCTLTVSGEEPLRWGHLDSDLPPDPAVHWGELENGVRFAILQNREPPSRLSLRLVVAAGSFMEAEEERGLAHFVEHMAFKGTEHFGAQEMVEYFQRLGMAFGADTNAHTTFHETVYKLELPEAHSGMLEDGLLLLRDYVDRMLFLEEEIEPERGVILAEKRDRDSVGFRTMVAELSFLAPDTLLVERLPIGLASVIREAPRERFVEFHERWYTADRVAIIAVGDGDPEEIEERIRHHFASLQPNPEPRPEPDVGTLEDRVLDVRVHREPEASDTRVSIQNALPMERSPDTIAKRVSRIRLELANAILSRRLELIARDDDAPFSRVFAGSGEWYDFLRNTYVEARTTPEQWEDALRVLESELRRALEHGFLDSELAWATANLLHRHEEAVLQRETRRSRPMADALARAVRQRNVFTSPEDELALARDVAESISVEQVHTALRDAWGEKQRLLFLSGDFPVDSPTEEEVLGVFANSQLEMVEALEEEEGLEFAYTAWGDPGEIVEREEIEGLGITRVRFANQVTALLKPTDFEDNVIRVGFRFGRGKLELPEEQAGLDLLAPSVYMEGGLEAHTAAELERIFAGVAVDSGFSVEEDSFLLTGRTNPRDLHHQVNLLTAYLTAPAFREAALARARRHAHNFYIQLSTTPEGVLRNEVDRLLGGGDFRFGYPALEDLLSRDMEALREWLEEPRAASALGVVLVGDFALETALQVLAETVGALPEREAVWPRLEDRRQIPFPPAAEQHTFQFHSALPRAVAMVIWPTQDMSDILRTRRLTLLANVVRDRLRIRLRQELGEAYSPFAFHEASDTYLGFGTLRAFSFADPASLPIISENILDIARNIVSGGIDEDEFLRAREPMVVSLREWVRDNRYWFANVLLPALESPQRFDWARNMRADIESITREEIEKLARQYLNEDSGITVHILPHPVTPDPIDPVEETSEKEEPEPPENEQ